MKRPADFTQRWGCRRSQLRYAHSRQRYAAAVTQRL